jgi:hypothetical protein
MDIAMTENWASKARLVPFFFVGVRNVEIFEHILDQRCRYLVWA